MRVHFVAVLPRRTLGGQIRDDLHRNAAGHFACVVTAHAVGQDHEADLGITADGIFVVVADAPRVRQFREVDLSLEAHGCYPSRRGPVYEYLAQFRSAIAISAPHENRSFGFLAMALANTVSTLGGMPARLLAIAAGSSVVIFVINNAMFVA